jgi:2C-methyl-D-erythritol 2,4-cyclodiphosphate synthase
MTITKNGWWKVNFELTLEGKEVKFDDLQEETQKHIAELIKQGFSSGEIVEECE